MNKKTAKQRIRRITQIFFRLWKVESLDFNMSFCFLIFDILFTEKGSELQ
jgi:hypothetical protein